MAGCGPSLETSRNRDRRSIYCLDSRGTTRVLTFGTILATTALTATVAVPTPSSVPVARERPGCEAPILTTDTAWFGRSP